MDMQKKNSKENKANEEDTRDYCKYGANCFQKNPDHHKKFKHPPSKKDNVEKALNSDKDENSRKRKSLDTESASTEAPQAKKQNVPPTPEIKVVPEIPKKAVVPEVPKKAVVPEVPKKAVVLDVPKKAVVPEVPKKSVVSEVPKKAVVPDVPKKAAVPEVPKKEVPKVQEKMEDPYSEAKKLIFKVFLVTMPNDFYKFYDFCNELKPSDPSTAFKIADLKLVGPYDVLNGVITKNTANQTDLLTHWRYYYDPPEFQTVLKGNDKEGLHFGYWRDRPSTEPVFVATNCCNVSHKIKPVAENIFGAVTNYLEERVKKVNPFEKTGFFNLLGKLKAYAKKYDISLETQSAKMKSREKNVVARTIHGAGITCPYNKKSQLGYRELSITDNQLLKIVKKIDDAKDDEDRAGPRSELDEVVRLATIAGDECDFGTCLELGHDLLSTGCTHVQNAALAVLSIAYNQLERQAFLKIVEAHMRDRKKGCNLSALVSSPKK